MVETKCIFCSVHPPARRRGEPCFEAACGWNEPKFLELRAMFAGDSDISAFCFLEALRRGPWLRVRVCSGHSGFSIQHSRPPRHCKINGLACFWRNHLGFLGFLQHSNLAEWQQQLILSAMLVDGPVHSNAKSVSWKRNSVQISPLLRFFSCCRRPLSHREGLAMSACWITSESYMNSL